MRGRLARIDALTGTTCDLRASPPALPPVLHPTAFEPQDLNRPQLAGVTQQRREFVIGAAFRFYVAQADIPEIRNICNLSSPSKMVSLFGSMFIVTILTQDVDRLDLCSSHAPGDVDC